MWVSPFRYLRIDGCVLLPAAFRSLPRLSSAPGAKASALCSFLLDQSLYGYSYSVRMYPCFFCCCTARLFTWLFFYFSDVLISSFFRGSGATFLRMDVSVVCMKFSRYRSNQCSGSGPHIFRSFSETPGSLPALKKILLFFVACYCLTTRQ